MADFNIPDASALATDVVTGMAKSGGSFLGSFIVSNVLTELGADTSQNQMSEIISDLNTIIDNQTKILEDLTEIKEAIGLSSLLTASALNVASLDTWISDFYDKDTGIASIEDPVARKNKIDELTSVINSSSSDGIATILTNIDNLIMGQNQLFPNSESTAGFLQTTMESLNLANNENLSFYDAYWFMRKYADSLFQFQYMAVTIQINASIYAPLNPDNPQSGIDQAITQLTLFGKRIMAQNVLLMGQTELLPDQITPIDPTGLMPFYCKVFGEIFEKQGYIKASLYNVNQGPIVTGSVLKENSAEGESIPNNSNGYLVVSTDSATNGANLIPGSSESPMTVLTLSNKSSALTLNITKDEHVVLSLPDGTGSIGKFRTDASNKASDWVIITADTPQKWLVVSDSTFAYLTFIASDTKSAWIYNHDVLPFQGQQEVGHDWSYTRMINSDAAEVSQQLKFGVAWKEEVLVPTVPGVAYAWAQSIHDVESPGVWVAGFKVRYRYAFISPMGESTMSPVVVLESTRSNTVDEEGYISSAGFIMTMMTLPADPLGLATSYKLYRQFSTEDDYLDITNESGVSWELQEDGTTIVVDQSTTSPTVTT